MSLFVVVFCLSISVSCRRLLFDVDVRVGVCWLCLVRVAFIVVICLLFDV